MRKMISFKKLNLICREEAIPKRGQSSNNFDYVYIYTNAKK